MPLREHWSILRGNGIISTFLPLLLMMVKGTNMSPTVVSFVSAETEKKVLPYTNKKSPGQSQNLVSTRIYRDIPEPNDDWSPQRLLHIFCDINEHTVHGVDWRYLQNNLKLVWLSDSFRAGNIKIFRLIFWFRCYWLSTNRTSESWVNVHIVLVLRYNYLRFFHLHAWVIMNLIKFWSDLRFR